VRRKKTVSLSEVQSIVEQARLEEDQRVYTLVSFNVMTGSQTLPVGSVELTREDTPLVQSATGTGPVDALCRAVDMAVGLNPRLILYSVDHLTEGKDARAEVTVSLAYLGRRFHGHSGSTDVVEASLRAYLDAVNSIETHRRCHPAEEFYINGEELWWE
jgi:2-isopropylmalate synthase